MPSPSARLPRVLSEAWCVAIIAATLVGGYHAGVLRVRVLLLGAVLLLLPATRRLWFDGDPVHRRMFGLTALAIAPLAGVTVALGDPPYEWLPQVALLLLGAAWLSATTATPGDGGESRAPEPRHWAAVILLTAGLTFGGEWLASSAAPRIVDESWFLMQADLLAHGRLRGSYPSGLERLYGIPLGRFADGAFTSQYPLGWPLLLAVPVKLGLERWLPPLLGFLAVLGAGLLARRVAGPAAGLAALVLAAGSPQLVLGSWTYFSHVVSAALLVYAALALEGAVRAARRPDGSGGLTEAAVCGLLGGVLFAARPLTAVAFGGVAAVRAVTGVGSPRAGARLLAALAVGFLGPAVLMLLGNAELNGAWHRFGYEYVNGSLAAMGFGDRGYFKWMPDGRLATEVVHFAPRQGAGYVVAGALAVLAMFLPLGLLPSLIARRDREGTPDAVRWWAVAVGALIAVHGFWFYRSTRFFEDAIPLLAAIAGCLLVSLPAWRSRAVAHTLQLALIGTAAVIGAAWLDRPWHRDVAATVSAITAASEDAPTVVVVEGREDRDAALQALFPLNGPRYGDRIAVVRDIGLSADSLHALFPGRTILRLACIPCDEQRRALHPAPRLERLPDASTAGSAP